jgi:hypothetical protein
LSQGPERDEKRRTDKNNKRDFHEGLPGWLEVIIRPEKFGAAKKL